MVARRARRSRLFARPNAGSSHSTGGRPPRQLNDDFRDLLVALHRAGARFIVVGAHAMAVHGVPRATGDLDVWIESTEANAEHAWRALCEFGAPVESLGVTREDLLRPGTVIQLGLPPRRIDLLTRITGVRFEDAWRGRVEQIFEGCSIAFLGRADLAANKRATGRAQDLADVVLLETSPDER